MVRLGCSVVWLLLCASVAAGQTVSSSTGAVNGRVTDDTGGVLPGVTVIASSPSLMGTRDAVTNEEGLYRFPALPPGDYTLMFELGGFQSVKREGIRVGLGFTATVNVEMGVASLEESLTVTGESPVVDTQATKITTNFDAETLASLPSARDYWAILAESPAVRLDRIDVGGSAAGTQTGYSVYGTSGQNRPFVEGINSTEATGGFGNYVDYGSFEEVAVGTGANGADMAVPGVQTQFISKSGGNEYHGSVYGDYENEDWQSYNIDEDQIARGVQGGGGLEPEDVNRLYRYYDFNAGAGGYIVKDRVWWFGSYRLLDTQARYTNFPALPHRTTLTNYTAKLTFNLTQNNKFIGYYQPSKKVQHTRLDRFRLNSRTAFHVSDLSSFRQDYKPLLWKVEYNSVLTDALFFEIRTGQFGYDWPDTNHPEAGPSIEDLGTSEVFGTARTRELLRRRYQVLGALSYFKDGLAGTHNLKLGWEIYRETSTQREFSGSYNDVIHILRNGTPIEVYLLENPTHSENGLWTYGMYLNDTWRLNNRLSMNVGVRFDRYTSFLPEQEHPAGRFNPQAQVFAEISNLNTFNTVAPRFGMTYDLTGDGKTVAKFNIGRYWWNPGADLSQTVNPNSTLWWTRYAWTDPSGNGQWEPGEEGRRLSSLGGVGSSTLDPELEDTYTDEIAAWFERELIPNFGVRTGFIWRGERQQYERINTNQPFDAFNVPVLVPDPGPDGVRDTGDDGEAIAGWNLDPAFLGLPTANRTTNVPNSDANYYTWEITGTKRMSDGWSLLASFSHTWNYSQENSYFDTDFRQNALVLTPNDLIHANEDGQHEWTDWSAKLHGTWMAPWGLKITPLLRHQAGQNFGRTIVAAFNYGNVRIPAEPLNTRRQDHVTIFDTRMEKVIPLRDNLRLSPFLDIFNMFNANPDQQITWASGSNFLRPSNIIPPRIIRIGAKFEF